MNEHVLVAGGGIGGLACALALARAGVAVDLLEQADTLHEVGAGMQLGPNAVRVLDAWGLLDELHACAAFPDELRVRDAHDARILGRLRLGAMALARYGQPYATAHRADLQALLLAAVQREPGVRLHLQTRLAAYEDTPAAVYATCENQAVHEARALIGCDGLWSQVRAQMLGEQPLRISGHLAYRGLVRTSDLPALLRSNAVTAWLGPRLHVVHYPVRQGEWFNVVAVVHEAPGSCRILHGEAQSTRAQSDRKQKQNLDSGSALESWTQEAHVADLRRALGPVCAELKGLVDAVPAWKLWALNDRPPLRGPGEHAQGRVALLGDAAHPLRPYLAQGAAMALEDAWTLGRLLTNRPPAVTVDWPDLLARYAQARWQRNALVQSRSQRNGTIFHATGLLRWGRNTAMRLLGEGLLDNPWLYQGPPDPLADA